MATVNIMQGDQYSIPIEIKQGDTVITSSNATALTIQLGDLTKSYPNGGLTYSTTDNAWLFPVTSANTLAMNAKIPLQIKLTIGTNIIMSQVQCVTVGEGIITGG